MLNLLNVTVVYSECPDVTQSMSYRVGLAFRPHIPSVTSALAKREMLATP